MIHYSGQYFAGTRTELLEKVQQKMSAKRFKHVLGVEQAALDLAKRNQVDLEMASVAALTHDYAKERTDAEFIAAIHAGNFDPDLLNWSNAIWHGVVGVYFIEKELGITNAAILQAVCCHTTGSAAMSPLDQVLYVADYIEPGRKFPGVVAARKIAAENLEQAVVFETQGTLSHLLQQKAPIYPKTIETYNRYVAQMLPKIGGELS
jgi:predicted HD superfamily hydrolase involved in NAD metabolism